MRWDCAFLLPRCEVLIANRFEAGKLTGRDDPAEAATRLGGRVGIVTLGRDGRVVAAGATLARYAAQRVTAVDTTGAGDTFAGVLVAIMVPGMNLASAIIAAQSAAALAVTRHGCFGAMPTRCELNEIIMIYGNTRAETTRPKSLRVNPSYNNDHRCRPPTRYRHFTPEMLSQ